MIAHLAGTLLSKGASSVVLECAGVGYEVRCTVPALEQLPIAGQPAALAIHTSVKEDAITLYGFASFEERDLFRVVVGVNGIGPRIGLALLSTYGSDEIHTMIADENITGLSRVPGIGPKTARRLALELRDRLKRMAVPAMTMPAGGIWHDLESGLVNLGYSTAAVGPVVDTLRRDHADEANLSLLLKRALHQLSR